MNIAVRSRWLLPATLALLANPPALLGADSLQATRTYRAEHGADILAEFAELLSIPNVTRDAPNVRRNAEWIRAAFARRHVELRLLELPNASPLIVGDLIVPGARRTLGIYVHYDGQPVDEREWSSPPWEPTLRTSSLETDGQHRPLPQPGEPIDPDWRLYARAAGDDKAPLIAILAALDALDSAGLEPTMSFRFMFEGEEEAGSRNLPRYLAEFGDQLDADVWLICDGPAHQSRRPQLVFGVRGITRLELTVFGASRYLHSGHYGNWAPNPAMELAQLLASMKDEAGNVVIDRFYDSVDPLSAEERAAVDRVPDVDRALMTDLALARTEADGSLKERLLLPSLNVRGLSSAAVGPLARNLIPTQAVASIDIRLVRGNDPDEMLDLVEEHIRRQGWHIIRFDPDRSTRLEHPRLIKVERGGGYRAARTSIDEPALDPIIAAADAAAREATGQGVVLMPSLGGSLPLYLFEDMLEAPFVIVPIANHDNNQHAPDENIRIGNLWYAIDLMGMLLTIEQ